MPIEKRAAAWRVDSPSSIAPTTYRSQWSTNTVGYRLEPGREKANIRVGAPKETKIHEYRVGPTPEAVREYVVRGHSVVIETEAGLGIGADDAA